jgi:hypothetical protein
MGIGLPGIGITGLFYVVAALLAPIRELVLTARGSSSQARWRLVGRQFGLALSVCAAVIFFYVGLAALARKGILTGYGGRHLGIGGIPAYLVAPMTMIFALAAATFYSWIVRLRTAEDPALIALAHREGVAVGAPSYTSSSHPARPARVARGSAATSGLSQRAPTPAIGVATRA